MNRRDLSLIPTGIRSSINPEERRKLPGSHAICSHNNLENRGIRRG